MKKASDYLAKMQSTEGFETREEQIIMANAVEKAFQQAEHLLVEAGTGVGKSLSYLIPAALYAIRNKKLVIISTETKALQNQLIEKDIELVSKITGQEINCQVAFGASNYLCRRKFQATIKAGNFGVEMQDHLEDFYDWQRETESGLKFEYDGFMTGEFWSQISRESDNCLGRHCPNFSHSYYFQEKEKWKSAHILIVNHYLLCSNIAGEFRILPEFEHLVVDEAHHFPEIVGKSFQLELSFSEIKKLIHFLQSKDKTKPGLVAKLKGKSLQKKLYKQLTSWDESLENYFQQLASLLPLIFNAKRISEALNPDDSQLEAIVKEIITSLQEARQLYEDSPEDLSEKEIVLELEMSLNRLDTYRAILKEFRTRQDSNLVLWVEPPREQDKHSFYYLYARPMNPEEKIREKLQPAMQTMIFTSATLSSGKQGFEFFKENLGLPEIDQLHLKSPFDYKNHSLLYFPKNIHDPGREADAYHADISKLIPMLIRLTEGNTFVLFTSNRSLKMVYENVVDAVDYPIFSQYHLGARRSHEKFLQEENSVLFGVSTFWQGIDVKGDKLKSVILTRIPFQPPGDPVLEAKIERYRENERNPFRELQLPHAILVFKQGFGRLIRSKTDTGIISILDPRITGKSYGKEILSALPDAKFVFSFKELKKEFKNLPKY